MENLLALKVFIEVADAGSFTVVGRQHGLSSSAIGKTVRRLEDRLGVRLFHRNTRSVALTQEGRLFVESCRRILREIDAIKHELTQTKGKPKGRLRVGIPLVGMVVLPVLSRFLSIYPDVELDIDFTDRPIDIVEGGYDVIVCSGEAKDSRLKTRSLGHYRYQIVGSPAYMERAGTPMVPAELAGHACLHQRHWGTGKLQHWPLPLSETGCQVVLPVTASSSAIEPLVALAEQGVGLVCVPDFAIRKQINEGSLVTVLDRFVEHEACLRAVWPASDYAPPKLRVFVAFLGKHLQRPYAEVAGWSTCADVEPENKRAFDVIRPPNSTGQVNLLRAVT